MFHLELQSWILDEYLELSNWFDFFIGQLKKLFKITHQFELFVWKSWNEPHVPIYEQCTPSSAPVNRNNTEKFY